MTTENMPGRNAPLSVQQALKRIDILKKEIEEVASRNQGIMKTKEEALVRAEEDLAEAVRNEALKQNSENAE